MSVLFSCMRELAWPRHSLTISLLIHSIILNFIWHSVILNKSCAYLSCYIYIIKTLPCFGEVTLFCKHDIWYPSFASWQIQVIINQIRHNLRSCVTNEKFWSCFFGFINHALAQLLYCDGYPYVGGGGKQMNLDQSFMNNVASSGA